MDNSEKNKQNHIWYRKKSFIINPLVSLTQKEFDFLSIHGSWMTALADGRIIPYTEAQQHFIDMITYKVEPIEWYEFAWIKYHQQINTSIYKRKKNIARKEIVKSLQQTEATTISNDNPSFETIQCHCKGYISECDLCYGKGFFERIKFI